MNVRHLFIAFLAFSLCGARAAGNPPNIMVFLVDDMGWQETSVPFHTERTKLNDIYHTPAMERLAAEGTKFTQAYACALCSPTRVSLMTGMNAARHHVTNWTLRKNASPDPPSKKISYPDWSVNGICTTGGTPHTTVVTGLPQLLKGAGYVSIHCGKAHFGAKDTPGSDPKEFGFDVNIAGHYAGGPGSYLSENHYSARFRGDDGTWDVPGLEKYYDSGAYLTEALTQEATKEVEKAVKEHKPFFLYMAHYAVHAPWEADPRYLQKYLDAGVPRSQAVLASMLEAMDKSLGDLMGTIKRLGIEDNTVVIFMSDNGSPSGLPPNLPLRGHKLMPNEGGIRVPMIVKWPGKTKPGTVNNTPVIIEDLFPTVLGAAGVDYKGKTSQVVDGRPIQPLLAGAPGDPARAFVWHYPHCYDKPPYSAIRQGKWKLIYNHIPRTFELYDLEADIGEKNNLVKDNVAKARELAKLLTDTLIERKAQMPLDKNTGKTVLWPYPLPEKS